MNTYFSRNEKILMTRVMILSGLLMETIKEYEKGTPDGKFMRGLRTANTWLEKALDRRFEFLDKDAVKDFIRHVEHMDLLFVPNDKAKKERKELQEMQDSLYMSAETFSRLYSSIIPFTCCNCRMKDFRKCMIREEFMRIGVLPIDTKAKDSCQYDYKAAGIDLLEWARQNLESGISIDEWAKLLPQSSRAKWKETKEKPSRREAGTAGDVQNGHQSLSHPKFIIRKGKLQCKRAKRGN